ncbi:MAG TPA: PQQ-binding-like beta-propeller repeat protein [Planctomycetota bacterium]|nr:PQQ-binding-like beta-propeller repeat protein [Planctomycetota bacterium]
MMVVARQAAFLLLLLCIGSHAIEVIDPLTDAKLADAWVEQKSDKGKPTITTGKDGLTIKCEPRLYAGIKRRNEIIGTDKNPLTVSCYMKTEGGFAVYPTVTIYWDNDNYLSLFAAWDNHFHVGWRLNGNEGQRPFYHTVPDLKNNGTYVRAIVTSQNCYVALSSDGMNWRRLADMGFRPKPGVAPGRIILGRGWAGERASKDAKPDLANDYYPDAAKNHITSVFKNFYLSDQPLPLNAAPLELQAKEDWDKTLEAVEAAGVPRAWTMLGPRPDREFKLFSRKDGLEPDHADDWKNTPKDETGKPFRITAWNRPEDDFNPYVDLSEILDPNTNVLAYARTEIDWPSEGPACLWFDDNGRAKVAVNNRWVFSDEGREQHGAVKDRYCVQVNMKKGKNVIKVKSGQNRGAWGFVLRLERNDPAFRIQLLEKLMELHPNEAIGWRGAQAMMEIARRYEELLHFDKAAAAWQQAIEKFHDVDEYREEALEGKLRLFENLKDWPGLLASAEQYLGKYPSGAGSDRAFHACVLAECCMQKFPAAEARVAKFVEQAGRDGRRVLWALRALAGAAEAGGDGARKYATLEKIADHTAVEQPERARAALEIAFWRSAVEHWRTQQGQKLDTASLKAACAAAKKGIALLPGGSIPIVQDWIKEAEEDLKGERFERAAAGYWGAAFLAMAASNPEAKPYLGINKTYKLPTLNIDPATKKPREPNEPVKQEAWTLLGQAINDVKWLGNGWRAIGPFENADGIGERTAYGPETTNDMTTPHPGRGGQKAWIDLDPKQWHELGQNLAQLGDCKGGVAYISREFECPDNRTTNLYIAVRAGWSAWLDGQLVGSKSEDWFRLDNNRIPIKLTPGKHRLLLKLVCPADDPFTARVRISDEPELGLNILRIAWLQREFPEISRYFQWHGDLWWLQTFLRWKTNAESIYTFGDAMATLYCAHSDMRWNYVSYSVDRLIEYGEYGDAAEAYRSFLLRLQTWAETPDRVAQISYVCTQLYNALANQGETAAGDDVLRTFIARYPDFYQGTGAALINRGILRQDFGIGQPSRPYFERAIREYPNADHNYRFAGGGLAFARTHLPERLQFESANDVQTAIEAATRQMKSGNAQDVERAMRNLGEAIRNGAGGTIRISDSRIAPLYVGVREYFRALLATLSDEMRGVYLKTVADVSNQRYQRAAEINSVAGLEAVAGEYHYTPAAAMAINRAGNLYLDRGAWAQAATAFKYLLQEYKGVEGFNEPLVAAKYARALLLDQQHAAAKIAAEVLAKDYAGKTVTVAGENVPVSQFAQKIIDQASKAGGTAKSGSATETYAGNPMRTGAPLNTAAPKPGPVAWARALSQSAGMDQARARYQPDPFRHIQPYPVVSGSRAFIGTQDGIQVLDLNSGQTVWRNIWGSAGSSIPGQFTGFPMSCPTVSDGRVCMRALNGRQSVLNCFDAESGRVLWSTAGLPELKRTVWISDPLVAYGIAVAVYMEPSDRNIHGVAAFDLQSGRMRWKTTLVTGSTGFRIGNDYVATTAQLGPPAAERGVIYTATGLNSFAAINAFSGEVVWVTGYPRIQTGVVWNGFAGNSGDLRNRVLKLLARGPASPVVTDDLVLLAPRDSLGVIAFERKNGHVRWRDELLDSRYVAGLCEGNVLFVDTTVKAVNASTGNLAWEYTLPGGDMLSGAPGYSGGLLYLPGEENLLLLDARTGRLQGSVPWDPRTGPVANLQITPQMIVGATESHAVGIAIEGGAKRELPLLEARQAVTAGNLELAADRFGKAIHSQDTDDIMPALSGWADAMAKLGKKDEALNAIDGLLQDKPALLEAPVNYWRINKSTFAEGLRARLGQAPAHGEVPPPGLPGSLVYAWQLQGENPRMFFPRDGAQDRFFAWAGNNLYCLRLSAQFEILWQVYVGPDSSSIAIGPGAIAVAGGQRLSVIDRNTGETLWQMGLPADKKRRKARANAGAFGYVAVDENSVAFTAGDGLFCYDLRTRKERWANERAQRKTLFLAFCNGKLGEVGSVADKNRYYTTYDPVTGNKIDNLLLGPGGDWTRTIQSPDGKLVIYRPTPHAILAVDLFNAKKAWEIQVPNLDVGHWHWTNLQMKYGVLLYNGDARDGPDKGWVTYHISLEDGKTLRKLVGGGGREGGSFVYAREAWGKIITRAEDDGKGGLKEVWKTTLPDPLIHYHYGIQSQLTKNFWHVVMVRETNGDQYVLRTWDWETGQVLQNEFIPGTPFRDYGNAIRNTVEFRGNLMLYSGHEGIFAYAASGQTRNDSVAKLKEQLAQPALPAPQRREVRRALAAIDAPTTQAFLTPAGARPDGDLSEWDQTEPIVIKSPQDYTPLNDDAAPRTAQDISAKIYSAWGADGVYLAVDVADDKLVPPRGGAPLNSGDSIKIQINSTSEPWYGFKHHENFVCSMALVDGRTVMSVWPEAQDGDEGKVSGAAARAPDGNGARYELFIPWSIIRREPWWRPADRKELRLGVAAYDDDGAGVEGAVEWGAAATSPTLAPMRLGQLSLLDISREKIERYRKVIEKLPDTAEAARFMELILVSKRGANADQERIEELEAFVKRHPSAASTNRVLSNLRELYKARGEADPLAKCVELAKAAKCPPSILDNVKGKVLKVWVLPDAANPPKMIMVQFNVKGWGWARRAYWGQPAVDWGRDGSGERKPMGPLPKLGQWTQLEIRPVDFDMEEQDIVGVAFTTFGGLVHWDRMSVVVSDKETELMNDAAPANFRFEGSPLQFVDNPKKDGQKAWTGGATQGLLNSHYYAPDVWFSFKSPAAGPAAAVDIKAVQALYRDAANVLPDTPEGLTFLKRVIELLDQKDKSYNANCVSELEKYLQSHPDTQHALSILQMLRSYYQAAGERNPVVRCEALMKQVKLSRDNCRAFYSAFSPTWMEFHVIGPFGAVGERRGMDQFLPPERNVDLSWTTKAFAEVEQAWVKNSWAKDDKGKPNDSGYVNLYPLLSAKLEAKDKQTLLRTPYFAYAYVKFNVPSKRRALLLYGVNDMISIWVNGRREVSEAAPGNAKDRELKAVNLVNGMNEVLIKVGVQQQQLGFFFRIADENGRPFDDVTFP